MQSQKQVRSLKFRILIEEGSYYLCHENKGADQLCSYCTADLRLCFRLCRLLVFPCDGSNHNFKFYSAVCGLCGTLGCSYSRKTALNFVMKCSTVNILILYTPVTFLMLRTVNICRVVRQVSRIRKQNQECLFKDCTIALISF